MPSAPAVPLTQIWSILPPPDLHGSLTSFRSFFQSSLQCGLSQPSLLKWHIFLSSSIPPAQPYHVVADTTHLLTLESKPLRTRICACFFSAVISNSTFLNEFRIVTLLQPVDVSKWHISSFWANCQMENFRDQSHTFIPEMGENLNKWLTSLSSTDFVT